VQSFAAFILLSAITSFSASANGAELSLCSPGRNSPKISFTYASYRTGDLSHCVEVVEKGLKLGFEAVAIVPSRVFVNGKIITESTQSDEEIKQCLQIIWDHKLDLIYQPHVEPEKIIHPDAPDAWRGTFDFQPDDQYYNAMFNPFLEWLSTHRKQVLNAHRTIRVIVAAELERSTTKYPEKWKALTSKMRKNLDELGLSSLVKIGYNPNWSPHADFKKDENSCTVFNQFVSSFDFVAPSFYGDWSRPFDSNHTPRGAEQVSTNREQMLEQLSNYLEAKCKVPAINKLPFSIGEFGVGSELDHAERVNWKAMESKDYQTSRRTIFKNFFDWARLQENASGTSSGFINFWTSGLFDPFGIRSDEHTIVDDELVQELSNYKKWRCYSLK